MEQTLVKKNEKKNGKLKTKQIINTEHKSNQTTQIKSSEIKKNVTRTAFCDRREIWHIYSSFLQSNNSLSLLVTEENFVLFHQVRNKTFPWRPCFLSNWDEMCKSYRGPSIDFSCKILRFCQAVSEKNFRNRRTRNNNCHDGDHVCQRLEQNV